MTDTIRTRPELTTLFADNTVGAITPQYMRDFIKSVPLTSEISGVSAPSYKTCYVDKNGSDSNDGSLAAPFLTVQAALNKVATGECVSVQVGSGDFDETATMTMGPITHSWSIQGKGTWSTNIRAIKIDCSTAIAGQGSNINFANFSMKLNHTDPCIEMVSGANLTHFHLDAENMYLSRSGAGLAGVKLSGTPGSGSDTGVRLTGITIFVDGADSCCVDLPHGIVQLIGGGIRSTNGPEIKTTTGAKYVISIGSLLGEGGAGIYKTQPCIDVVNSGTGLSVMLESTQVICGSGSIIDIPPGTGSATVFASELVIARGGTGGINNQAGVVILGNTVTELGTEVPVSVIHPAYKRYFKNAASTAFTPTTSSSWLTVPTTVQAALDELGGVNRSKICYVDKNGSDSNDGSAGAPFLTVQAALNKIATGDCLSVQVGAGAFDETATMTMTAATGSWSLKGAGTWSTKIRAIKIDCSTAVALQGSNIQFADFAMDINHADPCVEMISSANLSHYHLDTQNMYFYRSGANTTAIKVSGTAPSGADNGISLLGDTIQVDGADACCIDFPFGILLINGGGLRSTAGPEINTTTGAKYVILIGALLGEGGLGLGKTQPCIDVVNAGDGLSIMIESTQTIYGTGHIVNIPTGTGTASVFASEIVAVRNPAGTGGINNQAGAVIVGNTVDILTGAEVPVMTSAPAYVIRYKNAASTAFTPTTSGDWTTSPTTVQAALDELAAR